MQGGFKSKLLYCRFSLILFLTLYIILLQTQPIMLQNQVCSLHSSCSLAWQITQAKMIFVFQARPIYELETCLHIYELGLRMIMCGDQATSESCTGQASIIEVGVGLKMVRGRWALEAELALGYIPGSTIQTQATGPTRLIRRKPTFFTNNKVSS